MYIMPCAHLTTSHDSLDVYHQAATLWTSWRLWTSRSSSVATCSWSNSVRQAARRRGAGARPTVSRRSSSCASTPRGTSVTSTAPGPTARSRVPGTWPCQGQRRSRCRRWCRCCCQSQTASPWLPSLPAWSPGLSCSSAPVSPLSSARGGNACLENKKLRQLRMRCT